MEYRKMNKTEKCIKMTNPLPKGAAFCQDALFLDIETTGLSPSKNRIYLIGTARLSFAEKTPDVITIRQFFAETPKEEARILLEFQKLPEKSDAIVTFHGNAFDIPFLKERAKRLGLDTAVYENKNYVDLYQHVHAFRNILCLENYKQKTVEKFLGINREDAYSGGELIKTYKEYVKNPDEMLLHRLLLHNREDVLGMTRLLSIYAFDAFFNGGFVPAGCDIKPCRRMDGQAAWEAVISCQLQEPLPAPVSCHSSICYLHARESLATFFVPVFEGSLKYFYPDYKNYYYLPGEDMAVHKSIGIFTDKACRQKAKAANCYARKTGTFLPQLEEVITPAFYEEYKAPCAYFEWNADAGLNAGAGLLKRYCMHLLEVLKAGK